MGKTGQILLIHGKTFQVVSPMPSFELLSKLCVSVLRFRMVEAENSRQAVPFPGCNGCNGCNPPSLRPLNPKSRRRAFLQRRSPKISCSSVHLAANSFPHQPLFGLKLCMFCLIQINRGSPNSQYLIHICFEDTAAICLRTLCRV